MAPTAFLWALLASVTVFLPLITAVVIGLNTKKINYRIAQVSSTTAVFISSILSFFIFDYVAFDKHIININLFEWCSFRGNAVNWGIMIDPLTAIMLVVITLVSALVHLYSIGYMHDDAHKQRFMCYLSLFTFCMLILVTANNFIQMFFGWEGVGACSYLLIGFWYTKPAANAAAIKAFLVNRVGDFGFIIGIFLIYYLTGTFEFHRIFENIAMKPPLQTFIFFGHEISYITIACLLLFMGAMGKSAQLGLHIWLPDAMEGPTPVSALIHSATMVTAGVFMVVRCSAIFEQSEFALATITMVGATTCIFAASIALVQNDIKKIIAYSTCSQLGYMFFACGVSAYPLAIFHLTTHAFFKALLFLGAGSVIHALNGEQDIKKMGGLWKKIPFTYAMFWIGSLSLAGIFPFAGYYSKDLIIGSALVSHGYTGYFAYTCGLIAAIMTAFYSWRLIINVFHGENKTSKLEIKHIHESPYSMTLPLGFLAVGAIITGYFGENLLLISDANLSFWNGAIEIYDSNNNLAKIHKLPLLFKLAPLLLAFVGIVMAYMAYVCKNEFIINLNFNSLKLTRYLQNKFYFDEVYKAIFINTLKETGRFFWKKIDNVIIDGIPNGAALLTKIISVILSYLQSGYIYHYAAVMVATLILILTIVTSYL